MSMLKPKKKWCVGCESEQYLWKSNPPLCVKCANKGKVQKIKAPTAPIRQRRLKNPHEEPEIDYKQVYCEYFGYHRYDFVVCELSGAPAVDIHHIDSRGSGSSRFKDNIENLMAITRELHTEFGDIAELKEILYLMHNVFMETRHSIFHFSPSRQDLLDWHKEYTQ